MKVSAPNEGSSVDTETRARIAPETRLGSIHTGSRYVLGFGPESYGIWDEYSKDAPAELFPATDEGRRAALQRYLELEPSASPDVDERERAFAPDVEVVTHRRRWPIVVVIAVVVIGGIVALLLAKSNGGGGGATQAASVGKEAHLDITGAETASEDLTLSNFKASGTQAVFGGVTEATWKGATTQLHIELHSPQTGRSTTTQIPFRSIDITITPAGGTAIELSSSHGECSINVSTVADDALAGDFECAGLVPAGGTEGIDVKGTFAASS
ncbi:MAG: hypothetical protein E6G44_01100 [Actinobacteria bacterium]|nr:MAG: hypothetical protein E6G44_01100 [Actinomycetota bacterium]